MSSTQEGSSVCKGKGKASTGTRRSWSDNEEAILIAAVKELIVQGWKSDNGFRAGYLNKLEEAMKKHFPETDLKGTPHINSRLSTWKKTYGTLCTILGKSGVGFNTNGDFKIDLMDDECWDGLVKLDSNAKSMRRKSWPYYMDWKEIFGKDRANGNAAEDITDAWNEVRTQGNTGEGGRGVEYDVSLEDLAENETAEDNISNTDPLTPSPHPKFPNKKRKGNSDEVSNLCTVLTDFGGKVDERLASLADSIAYEARLGQAAEDAFEELGKIEGLSMEQRFDVCEILSANVDKVRIFKGLPNAARPEYVKRLLRNKGKEV